MKQYIKTNTEDTTWFNLACGFEGEYSEDWDTELLETIINEVFDNFSLSVSDIDMYEWPDLYEDYDEYLCGMGIDISCKGTVGKSTCIKLLGSLQSKLSENGYDLADSSYEYR